MAGVGQISSNGSLQRNVHASQGPFIHIVVDLAREKGYLIPLIEQNYKCGASSFTCLPFKVSVLLANFKIVTFG